MRPLFAQSLETCYVCVLVHLEAAAPYTISNDQVEAIGEAVPEARAAFLHGLAKAAQQKLRYVLYGIFQGIVGNHFNAPVFLKNAIPVDRVRTHLGLKDLDPERCFMDL